MQIKCLEDIERKERQKHSELRFELYSNLNNYHTTEMVELQTKQSIEILEIEFLFEKIFCLFENAPQGFTKFSKDAETKLNEIMVRDEKAVLGVILKSKESKKDSFILEKEQTFDCVFDNIYKFLYRYWSCTEVLNRK